MNWFFHHRETSEGKPAVAEVVKVWKVKGGKV
jgi:hypothetical protein